jgi:hypothetical protein
MHATDRHRHKPAHTAHRARVIARTFAFQDERWREALSVEAFSPLHCGALSRHFIGGIAAAVGLAMSIW